MWIRSQDETELLDIIRFKVVKTFSGPKKGYLYGYISGSTLFRNNSYLLGHYSTYEVALAELKDIEKAIEDGLTTIYKL